MREAGRWQRLKKVYQSGAIVWDDDGPIEGFEAVLYKFKAAICILLDRRLSVWKHDDWVGVKAWNHHLGMYGDEWTELAVTRGWTKWYYSVFTNGA